ncbi:MAG TPA: asparagine synthase (glutamine-hydrolyzing) [Candidatus Angelobacter sp.]|nr:asparagine synthase (glutamine-hydrolyzing) [Candidatus Angelobacter sp.]
MCGIAGIFIRSAAQEAEEADLRQMLALLRHRGPDEFGVLLDREAGIGNARLSIIDLSGGSQPITNEDGSLWIVFNGEIFNYIELRAELETRGHRFRTSSDTEVILHLFEEFGPRCLDRLNGQFAIAIWDTLRRRLFLARDRLGVRPLFYTETAKNTLLFASEIKSILSDRRMSAEIDPMTVDQIFRFWAPLTPNTVFRGVVELPPAHFLVADRDSLRVEQYWNSSFPIETNGSSESKSAKPVEEIVEEFRALLIDACRIRLRADVPVGAYLSGGLDSSTIASIVRRHTSNKLVTFSIAFSDQQFDESPFQREMAARLGTDHHVIRATHADIGRTFPDVIWHTEVPVMRTAPAPMFLLSRLVRETGFKVVLTGEGADEFLAGYDLFKEAKVRRFWARQPQSKWRPLLFKRLYPDIGGLGQTNQAFLSAFFGEGLDEVGSPWYSHAVRWRNNRRTRRFFNDDVAVDNEARFFDHLASMLPAGFKHWAPLARAQYLEILVFLSQYLLSSQGDRMGMAHSIEGRFPFLDVRLVEFCNALDARMKLRCLREKWLLKRAAQAWLPDAISRRPKRPYRAPIHRSFFNGATPDYVRDLLSPDSIRDSGLFKAGPVEQLVRKIENGSTIGETDDMALVGIVSTQLVHHLFVKHFRRPEPLSEKDPVKVCRINSPTEKELHAIH